MRLRHSPELVHLCSRELVHPCNRDRVRGVALQAIIAVALRPAGRDELAQRDPRLTCVRRE